MPNQTRIRHNRRIDSRADSGANTPGMLLCVYHEFLSLLRAVHSIHYFNYIIFFLQDIFLISCLQHNYLIKKSIKL